MSAQALKYKEKGNAEFKKGNHGKAIEYYTYAVEMDPRNHIFFTNRATAYFKMARFDKSLRDSNKAIKLNNGWWKGHLKKAESLMALERFDDAEVAAQLGLQLFSDKPHFKNLKDKAKRAKMKGMSTAEIHKVEGNDHFKSGRIEKAIASYTSAICAMDTKTASGKAIAAACYGNRAACNRQLYLHDKVVKDATKALEYNPQHVKSYIRRAQSYESLEKYELALADFTTASGMNGGTVATSGASRVRQGLRQLEKLKAKEKSRR